MIDYIVIESFGLISPICDLEDTLYMCCISTKIKKKKETLMRPLSINYYFTNINIDDNFTKGTASARLIKEATSAYRRV